jgi:hypothetical protein
MSTVAMSGKDISVINNRILNDLADGDCIKLSYPNEIISVKTGKNGNAIYGLNESGKQADLELRIIRGSDDDKFLASILTQQQANTAEFPLMTGEFVKQVGNGKGNVASDTYITSGGVFTKQVEAKSNVEGDSEQSVAIYHVRFSNAPRVIT